MPEDDIPTASGRPRRTAPAGDAIAAPKAAGGLYLVATPIGNLSDISLRALELLAGADVIACEDTRVTRKLTERYGIATPLTPYHEHNAAEARPKLLDQQRRRIERPPHDQQMRRRFDDPMML